MPVQNHGQLPFSTMDSSIIQATLSYKRKAYCSKYKTEECYSLIVTQYHSKVTEDLLDFLSLWRYIVFSFTQN